MWDRYFRTLQEFKRQAGGPASHEHWINEVGNNNKSVRHFLKESGMVRISPVPVGEANLDKLPYITEAKLYQAYICSAANKAMKPFHNRMPVILSGDEIDQWLDPGADLNPQEGLLRPFAGELAIDRVSKAVNNPRNDSPDILRIPPAA